MNAAKSLLIESGGSVKNVALKLGFPDAYTFSRQFSKIVGLPPSEYKKMY
jgi:transcriptional regulator GlxA family with amidase domain